jgi:hypothetical protein
VGFNALYARFAAAASAPAGEVRVHAADAELTFAGWLGALEEIAALLFPRSAAVPDRTAAWKRLLTQAIIFIPPPPSLSINRSINQSITNSRIHSLFRSQSRSLTSWNWESDRPALRMFQMVLKLNFI